MAKLAFTVVVLLKFVVITTQWNHDVQRSHEDLYDLKKILKKLGAKNKEQLNYSHIKPKYYTSNIKHKHSDEEDQSIKLHALKYLFKNDKNVATSLEHIENSKLCKAGRCGCGRGGLRCGNNRNDKDNSIISKGGLQQLLHELETEIEKDGANSYKKLGAKMLSDGFDNNDITNPSILIEELKQHGKKYKVNDDVDAIVLDMSHLDELLGNLHSLCLGGKCNNDRIRHESNELAKLDEGNKLGSDVDAVVIDVTGEQSGDTFAKQLKNLLTNKSENKLTLYPEDLFTYYQLYKNLIIDKIMDYVRNKDGRKKGIQNVTEKQRRLIDNVKHLTQHTGLTLSEKQIKKQIGRIIFGEHSLSKVVPHHENNNNIYVPKWFYKKVVKSKNDSNLRVHKRLFPLTLQQRQRKSRTTERLWRRDSGPNVENYGVPFELQVQGLGQAIP